MSPAEKSPLDTRPADRSRPAPAGVAADDLSPGGKLPRHVAVIMDGNGRWAKQRGLPRVAGHQAARRSVREVVEGCAELGLEALTLYTFSTENWHRPPDEVQSLMRFLCQVLVEERETLTKNNVQLQAIGHLEELPEFVREELARTREMLSRNDGLKLVLALSYSSRRELTDAFRRMAEDVRSGRLDPSQIDEAAIDQRLYAPELPHPDLLIRTSGEMRLSNFLLWQLAYAEIYVTPTLWPDFRKRDLHSALAEYQKRERRFGRVE